MTAKPTSALSPPTHLQTVAEFEQWQRQHAPEGRYEFVRGQIIEKNEKSQVESRILTVLTDRTHAHQQGDVLIAERDVYVDDTRKRRPDLAYYTQEQLLEIRKGLHPKTRFVVEVLSGSEAYQDVLDKIQDYFDAGTELVWYIIPGSQKIYAYTSPNELKGYLNTDVVSAAPVIPDFQFAVADLFG